MRATLFKRLGAMLMVLVMTAAFMPVLNLQHVYAGGGTDIDGIISGLNSDGTASVGKTLTVKFTDIDDKYGGDFKSAYENGTASAGWSIAKAETGDSEPVAVAGTYSGGVFSYTITAEDEGKWIRFETINKGDTIINFNNQTEPHSITGPLPSAANYLIKTKIKAYNGPFTLVGHSDSYTFKSVDIYTTGGKYKKSLPSSEISGKSDFTFDFTDAYLAGLDPDAYTVEAVLNDSAGTTLEMSIYIASSDMLVPTSFTAPITDKVAISRNANFFSAGSNYICFRPYFTVNKNIGYIAIKLYDTKTKQWGDTYGPFDSYEILRTEYFKGDKNSSGTKVKIQPNRTYKVVAFYEKKLSNGGTTWWEQGPVSSAVTITTGKKAAPAVKSVTAKAVKKKKVALIQHAHWDVNGKWIPYKKSYVWTTTYKVTVKLKKKPGTKGIYIGDKKCKGNKKKYTATFTDSGKLKGKTIKISICSYNDNTLGAYSKAVKKKVKIK